MYLLMECAVRYNGVGCKLNVSGKGVGGGGLTSLTTKDENFITDEHV